MFTLLGSRCSVRVQVRLVRVQVRCCVLAVLGSACLAAAASADVVGVAITSREPVADGRSFGNAGAYERLSGTIEFALDPADPHNRGIVNLGTATRADDGRVHFTATLYVMQPVAPEKGNGVLLFEIANRGTKDLLSRFNNGTGGSDPRDSRSVGDGFLMREGYTLVWVGWEFDIPAPGVRVEAPAAIVDASQTLTVEQVFDSASPTGTFADAFAYPPARLDDAAATLSVRDTFWTAPQLIPRNRWRFTATDQAPAVALEGGFEPGRVYALTYHPARAFVAGVGLAAIRDAASAFRYRTDLPVRGRSAFVFGMSQSGRFLREFLASGFNADERDRRVFDAIWAHVAGAARGSFNDTYAMPRSFQAFKATRPPFADQAVDGRDDGLETRYRPGQRPKVFYTNSPTEYWGSGRAAALIHTSVDGRRDLKLPDNVRIYFYAGVQHAAPATFPPGRPNVQQRLNPTPQHVISRALLRALYAWATRDAAPPDSRYPRLGDGTLVQASRVRFPAVPGVADPRRIQGPGIAGESGAIPLPFLVPQVNADGNEVAGVLGPDLAVPLATVTGWNFRSREAGNPSDIYPLRGSYLPFAPTRRAREAAGDSRRSIEERYPSRNSYLQRVRAAAQQLIKQRFLLDEDLAAVMAYAERHWAFATNANPNPNPNPNQNTN